MLLDSNAGRLNRRIVAAAKALEAFPKLSFTDDLLTEKEVCFLLKRSRWWLWRRKKEGLPMVAHRIGGLQLAWWLEQRDAALTLGMEVRAFMGLPRGKRVALVDKACEVRCNLLPPMSSGR